jgi:hypothetical protein
MPKYITFGPVTHPNKSYAYALGYGAYHMGHRISDNPYAHRGESRYDKMCAEDYDLGFRKAVTDANTKMAEILERRTKGES